MEKLIKLLNEHTNGRFKTEEDLKLCMEMNGYRKKFIKRLVDNDKIDLDKIEKKSEYTFIKNGWWEHIIEDVLMLLSISETPIEDLIYYLK